jgi:hypothetical protein
MKSKKIKPPVYFIPEENKAKKRTFLFIKTGAKSYAVSLTNLISSQKEGVDFQGKIDNKG